VRHLFATYEPGEDKLFGHIKPCKNRAAANNAEIARVGARWLA
jgi:hypothetical protein